MATKRKATGAGAGFITPRPAWEYSPAQSAVKKRVEEQYGLGKKTSRAAGGRVVAAPMTQNDAIVIKALKLASFFHNNNKNLTKYQNELVRQLWDVLSNWHYVRTNLHEYNLDGVRVKKALGEVIRTEYIRYCADKYRAEKRAKNSRA